MQTTHFCCIPEAEGRQPTNCLFQVPGSLGFLLLYGQTFHIILTNHISFHVNHPFLSDPRGFATNIQVSLFLKSCMKTVCKKKFCFQIILGRQCFISYFSQACSSLTVQRFFRRKEQPVNHPLVFFSDISLNMREDDLFSHVQTYVTQLERSQHRVRRMELPNPS